MSRVVAKVSKAGLKKLTRLESVKIFAVFGRLFLQELANELFSRENHPKRVNNLSDYQ